MPVRRRAIAYHHLLTISAAGLARRDRCARSSPTARSSPRTARTPPTSSSTARRSPASADDLAGGGATADETIDATGKYVIPGGIDVHTHMELPFGGTFAKDTFETGTRAAAFGGTTSIVDFAVQSRGAVAARGPRRLARQGRGQRRHRLRLPHDHERRQRRHAGRDGRSSSPRASRTSSCSPPTRASSTATTGRSSGRCSRPRRTAG